MNLCAKSQRKGMNNLRGIKEHFEVIDTLTRKTQQPRSLLHSPMITFHAQNSSLSLQGALAAFLDIH